MGHTVDYLKEMKYHDCIIHGIDISKTYIPQLYYTWD